jgi:hypothetical protein
VLEKAAKLFSQLQDGNLVSNGHLALQALVNDKEYTVSRQEQIQ